MGHGGWKTPFSVRFGGNAHEVVESNYNRIQQNLGDAFSTDEDSASDAETQAQARLLGRVDALLRGYTEQSDPKALTTLLSRWEKILLITPKLGDTETQRRKKVASRVLGVYDATSVSIDRIAREAFYPWKTKIVYVDSDDAVQYWPGGNSHPNFSWYTTIAHIVVAYSKPNYASREKANERRANCMQALDLYLPAWATYSLSEMAVTGTNANKSGFFLDQPNLDLCCLG